MLHVCRDHNMLAEFTDYPVDAFNWDAHGAGNLGLAEGRSALGGKCVTLCTGCRAAGVALPRVSVGSVVDAIVRAQNDRGGSYVAVRRLELI